MFLTGYDLTLPHVPTDEEWQRMISDLEGMNKEVVIVQAKGCSLLRNIEEKQATTERIGWLNIWSKSLTVLESAISAYEIRSGFLLNILSRAAFEWVLHVLTIIDPLSNFFNQTHNNPKVEINTRSIDLMKKPVIDRLRAYTAWCLCSDKKYYEEISGSKTLDGIWNPNPARDLIHNKQAMEFYEQFIGKLDIEVADEEVCKGRHDFKRKYKERIDKIDHWLQDPNLKPWADKIRRLPYNEDNFFSLFKKEGERSSSIRSQLIKHKVHFSYGLYSASSMILHGSTMEHFMMIEDSFVAPKLSFEESKTDAYFDLIMTDCNMIFLYLGMLDHFVLSKTELRG